LIFSISPSRLKVQETRPLRRTYSSYSA
jgi:hypothetical protein